MFDKARERVASRISPKAVLSKAAPYNVFSQRTPGTPVYSDLTIRKATREGYKLSLYVYRAVRTIVQSASGIPWIVLDKDGEEIPNHPFTEAWSKPNPFFSGQDNMEFLTAHLKLVGNAMIQPIMVGGQPKEFWVCMPDLIHPVPSNDPSKWIDGYQVTEADGSQRAQLAPPETFVHFMQFNPGDPYWGIGDLQAAARTVDTDNEMQDTQKVSMQNRGTPDGVFVTDVAMSTEQWEEAQRQVKEKYTNKKSRREPWILGAGYKWYQMSLTPVEMDFINSRLRNLDDIATAFGLDPWWLGDRRQSTYNNLIEAKKALYELVVIPLLDDIKATLNLKVAPLYGNDITITYDLSGVTALREDFGAKVDQAGKMFAMGIPVSQANDVLGLGLQEFPGWNNSYLPFSLAPVGYSTPAEDTEKTTGTKMLNMNDEQKAAHWRRIDTRRSSWYPIAEKKFKAVYDEQSASVLKAIGNLKSVKNMTPRDWQDAYAEGVPHWAEDKTPSLFAQEFVQELSIRKLKSVLEIGCGNGRDSIFFARAGFNATGIDVAPGAIKLAKQNAKDAEVAVSFQVANAEKMSFEDGQFNAVFSLSVLHSSNLSKSIPEINRVLSSKGVAFIYLYGDTQYADGHRDDIITVDDYTELLKSNGFELLDFYSEQEKEFDEYGEKHLLLVALLQKGKQ